MTWSTRFWATIKDVYLRITLNRYTTTFFLFSFIHCFALGITQSFTYTVDASTSDVLSTILRVARANDPTVFALLLKDGTLQHCTATPIEKHTSPCMDVYRPTGEPAVKALMTCPEDVSMPLSMNTIDGGSAGMSVQMPDNNNSIVFIQPAVSRCEVTLTKMCTDTLVYPDQVLKNLMREDLSLIGSQFWVFCISVYGLIYGSIPHIIAAFCTRVLAAGWSSYMIWRTGSYIQRLERLTTNGACGYDFFSTWLEARRVYQIPDVVFTTVALVVSGILTWMLCRTYNRQMFNRVGAPGHLFPLYRLFLALFVCLQLSCFYLVTAMGLWIDQLSNGAIAVFSSWTPVYKALFISTSILLIPWVVMGWYSIRREMKKTAFAFLALAFVFIACWAIMFYSQVYRWTFIQWPFFGCMTTASFIVLVLSLGLGFVCWLNFDKGLAQFLHAESVLARSDFEPEVFVREPEKFDPEKGQAGPDRKPSLRQRFSALSSLPVLSKWYGQPSDDHGFVIVPVNRAEK